ncbi:MAG TPA: plastocyanin/azurin family copper-binding protein [Blastocatellia bacterium]|nr:plastocyanin/azurin family copper-binding protein [Blastocatellia bacterium]
MKKGNRVAIWASVLCLSFMVYTTMFLASSFGDVNSGGGAPAVTKIKISNFKFDPKDITVKVGTTVTWENTEGTHSVNADDGSFSSPNLTAGKTFSHRFTKAGTYGYYCSFHGSKGGGDMSGTITVQ